MSKGWDSLSGRWNAIKQFVCHAITDHANADCVAWTASEPTARDPREFHYQCKCGYRFWSHMPPKGWKDIETCEFCKHYTSIDEYTGTCSANDFEADNDGWCDRYVKADGAVVDNDHLLKPSR